MHHCLKLLSLAALAGLSSCSSTRGPAADGSFASVKLVLEGNCVHCHGKSRLAWMPPLDSTASLAGLIGPHRQIVPGKPDASRFFQVVTLADDQIGAMPPTGHALDAASVQVLRAWISAGAQVPQPPQPLVPSGEMPRSR